MRRLGSRLRALLGDGAGAPEELIELTDEDRRYLTSLHDDSVPLPPGAHRELRDEHPRLTELRERYAGSSLPATDASRWHRAAIESFLDLRYFRGETLITWHYRELPRITRLKYYVLLRQISDRDELGLLDRLEEDGAFGCWTYSFTGYPRISRDLLDSVNEISFLERQLRLSERRGLRVLDVGAGYGRLAHRMTAAFPDLDDYCCVDAIPESTFLSEFYLRFRGCAPPARVVALDEIADGLSAGDFDLAVNVHSFSECTHRAIGWWIGELERLEVPDLLIVPNDAAGLLSLEADRGRRDYEPVLERAGYRLVAREPVVGDPAARELLDLHDHFHLFRLGG